MVLHEKDERLSVEQVRQLLAAQKRFSVELREVSQENVLFDLGLLIGERMPETFFTLLLDEDTTEYMSARGVPAWTPAAERKKPASVAKKKRKAPSGKTDEAAARGAIVLPVETAGDGMTGNTADNHKASETAVSESGEKPCSQDAASGQEHSASIPRDHMKMFVALMGVRARDLTDYPGRDENLALEIGDILTDVLDGDGVNINHRMEQQMIRKFGEQNGKKVYDAVQPNFELFLKPHLTRVLSTQKN